MRSTAISSLSRLRFIAVVLGLALVAVGAMTAGFILTSRPAVGAGGGSGCLLTTPACNFKNHMAQADFGTASTDGCTFTDASVQPFESLSVPGRQTSSTAFVSFFAFNACTGTPLYSFSDFDPSTGVPAFTGTVQFGTGVSSASVNGTATMFDDLTGEVAFISTVNLTWESYGPISSFINGFHFRAPGFVVNGHDVGHSRGATAGGTFTDSTGNNLASVPTINASVEQDMSGQVLVSRV